MSSKIIGVVVALAIVGGGAFYGGVQYNQRKTAADREARRAQFGAGNFGGANGETRGQRAGGGGASGEILSKDDKSITVKLLGGGSKIIFLSPATRIMKDALGSLSDLTLGQAVMANGSSNPDGSMSADAIQIRPAAPAAASTVASNAITVVGNNFSFAPATITAKKGQKVAILFKNAEGFHDFKIDEFAVATKRLRAGDEERIEFTPDKTGTFEFYCSVGSHRAMGMKGTLVVE